MDKAFSYLHDAGMTRSTFRILLLLTLSLPSLATAAEPADTRCYELRTYTASPGRMEALQKRFREHTVALFAKHGMTNVGYWVQVEKPEGKLIYLLSFPNRAARDVSFKAFGSDPEWQAVYKESEKVGTLVSKVESQFLTATDFSKTDKVEPGKDGRIYELRTYTCGPNNLPHLLSRFRDHTVGLFSKHGMKHFGYWTPSKGEPGADTTLIYLLIHDSKEAMDASFKTFREDPIWTSAKEASEKAAGGSLTIPDGVKSLPLTATDFSPAK